MKNIQFILIFVSRQPLPLKMVTSSHKYFQCKLKNIHEVFPLKSILTWKKILWRINFVLIKFSPNVLLFEKLQNECKNPSFLHKVTCIKARVHTIHNMSIDMSIDIVAPQMSIVRRHLHLNRHVVKQNHSTLIIYHHRNKKQPIFFSIYPTLCSQCQPTYRVIHLKCPKRQALRLVKDAFNPPTKFAMWLGRHREIHGFFF